MKKYTLNNGKTSFPSFLSKEHWITQGNIMQLHYILNEDPNRSHLYEHQKEHLNCILNALVKQEKRMRKQLVKNGLMTK